MCQQNINRHQQQHHQHLHHHYYIITIIINIIIFIIIIDLLGLNRKKIGQFSQCHTLLVSKRERWIVWVWWKIKSRLLPNASIFRLPSEPQINNFMQTIVEIWSTGNEESTQGIRDKRCATEIYNKLFCLPRPFNKNYTLHITLHVTCHTVVCFIQIWQDSIESITGGVELLTE